MKRAFTLIELLIVVLIIAILAAIALPNFLEFQVRAKVSRVKADMRSMQTAILAYRIDFNTFPPDNFPGQVFDQESLYYLSSPIAYITTVPTSPFQEWAPAGQDPSQYYEYWLGNETGFDPGAGATGINYRLTSVGPNRSSEYHKSQFSNAPQDMQPKSPQFINGLYDPTNGTVSDGDIIISNRGFEN